MKPPCKSRFLGRPGGACVCGFASLPLFLFIAFLSTQCQEDMRPRTHMLTPPQETRVHHSGEADLSRFIALGDGWSAGVQNGTLYDQAQKDALPAIIADALKPLLKEPFRQPNINSENGYLPTHSNPKAGQYRGQLRLTLTNVKALQSDASAFPSSDNPAFRYGGSKLLNNYAVPDLKIADVDDNRLGDWRLYTGEWATFDNKTERLNAYYARFARSPNESLLTAIKARKPTFFLLWLGLEDVLHYAIEGARPQIQLTDIATFEKHYTHILDELIDASPNNKGLLVNLPDLVESLPFFNYFNEHTIIPIPQQDGTIQLFEVINEHRAKALNEHYKDHNERLKALHDEGGAFR